MYTLTCDRPRFLRIYGKDFAALAQRQFRCPVRGDEGSICPLAPAPCEVYTAGPFDDFFSIAARLGLDGEKLAAFNGGAVWPSRRIYLYDSMEQGTGNRG